MAKFMAETSHIECGRKPCEECKWCGCERSEEADCTDYLIAEHLYNAGYRKQSEWISVDERLPAENRNYIVSCNDEYGDIWCENDVVVVAEYYRGSWTWYDNGSEYTLDNIVTHWMPLPEAPKMKGGEE